MICQWVVARRLVGSLVWDGPVKRVIRSARWRGFSGAALMAFAAAALVVAWVTMELSSQLYLDNLYQRSRATLSVQAAGLEKYLDKYRLLPPLLARSSDITQILSANEKDRGRNMARVLAGMSGAQEVWFQKPSGAVVASNLPEATGLAYKGISQYEQAFAATREGRLGRQLVFSPDGRSASYVFMSPVRRGLVDYGVIAVRVSLEELEQSWALSKDRLVAVDQNGRVVATNQSSWQGLPLYARRPAGGGRNSETGEGVIERRWYDFDFMVVRLTEPFAKTSQLMVTQQLPVLSWTVVLFADTQEVREQSLRAGLIALLLCVIGGGGLWIVGGRRRRLLERYEQNKRDAERLEQRVQERTKALLAANAKLAREVKEREAAEKELQRAQAGLVQSAKLATLGEMSAAISHEFNQPLGAMRTHAENAQVLIDGGKAERAKKSLNRIVAMVERMAAISQTLKGFTRKASSDVTAVRVSHVIDEVVMLTGPRCKQMNVAIEVVQDNREIDALAGPVRLSQVLVNLVSNALDAMKDEASPQLRVGVVLEPDWVVVRVEDNGPGIAPDVVAQIFDPFFTTKEVGEGLGLGLSIAYKIIEDLGGRLQYAPSELGGACFVLKLRPVGRSPAHAGEDDT